MSDEEKVYLRAIYAGLAMNGLIVKGDYTLAAIPKMAIEIGDHLMTQLEPQEGIAKARRTKVG